MTVTTDLVSVVSLEFIINFILIILGCSVCSFLCFKILFFGSKTKLRLIDGLYASNFLCIATVLPFKVCHCRPHSSPRLATLFQFFFLYQIGVTGWIKMNVPHLQNMADVVLISSCPR